MSDAVIHAVGYLVDDSQSDTRVPSHADLEQQFRRAGLLDADPNKPGDPPVGKRKRVQTVLSWALEHEAEHGERLVSMLISLIRSVGGFRESSPNYVGREVVLNAQDVFRGEGFTLSDDGDLLQQLLDGLSGVRMTEALKRYVQRARRGADDAALVTGTGKDLVEATAAHVLVERTGAYPTTANFPTLLGQAFVDLGLAYDTQAAKTPRDRLDAALYAAALAANTLRNKEGTGHGRPFLSTVTRSEAKITIGVMGVVAERLLLALEDVR